MSELPQTTVSIHQVSDELDERTLSDVRQLAKDSLNVDGNPPLSDQTLVALAADDASENIITLLAEVGEGTESVLAGIAVVVREAADQPWVLEVVVHPDHRKTGIGRALLTKLSELIDLPQAQAWAHGDHEAAKKLASRIGMSRVRELYRMRREGTDFLEEAPVDRRISVRSFRVGEDEPAWLESNSQAFVHHPEQGSLTLGDLEARMAEDWFDPSGFFLAFNAEQKLVAYHWTKIHQTSGESIRPTGEVYVVGVVPEAQGMGLGRSLTTTGINYLLEQGVDAVILYVDAENEAAVKLYRSLGFTLWDADIMYGPQPID
ncbi:mycothiol synthase [Glutamicibacter sp. M10]|uniref:mycothiol synthase n=1 Tax=Glutamicibacter sp. M10 TaxID=3023076 RepID=UPI0021C92B14|nr:mycothiol synthase [Glutamicibacter sp. M10]UXN33275.1 mycothiol synthase [Glutamicibacter sp. M10]